MASQLRNFLRRENVLIRVAFEHLLEVFLPRKPQVHELVGYAEQTVQVIDSRCSSIHYMLRAGEVEVPSEAPLVLLSADLW